MEVRRQLAAGHRREISQRNGEGLGHDTADLDDRVLGDCGGRAVETHAEARKPVDALLSGREGSRVWLHLGLPSIRLRMEQARRHAIAVSIRRRMGESRDDHGSHCSVAVGR
jgi:hypothetical protein